MEFPVPCFPKLIICDSFWVMIQHPCPEIAPDSSEYDHSATQLQAAQIQSYTSVSSLLLLLSFFQHGKPRQRENVTKMYMCGRKITASGHDLFTYFMIRTHQVGMPWSIKSLPLPHCNNASILPSFVKWCKHHVMKQTHKKQHHASILTKRCLYLSFETQKESDHSNSGWWNLHALIRRGKSESWQNVNHCFMARKLWGKAECCRNRGIDGKPFVQPGLWPG